jgi:3-oxoadipate CoA-transferase beta subunit
VATVHEMVELGALDPESVVTPGVYVQRLVQVPRRSTRGRRLQGRLRQGDMNKWTRTRWPPGGAPTSPKARWSTWASALPTPGGQPPAGRPRGHPAQRERRAGHGPGAGAGEEDYDLINAGKQPVTLKPGGCFFHHADSFAMMRGGHIDICVLGAFQVAGNGDLANWHTGEAGAIPAVGGAMDLATGAKQTWVMMEHVTKAGEPKLVERCSVPAHRPGLREAASTPTWR